MDALLFLNGKLVQKKIMITQHFYLLRIVCIKNTGTRFNDQRALIDNKKTNHEVKKPNGRMMVGSFAITSQNIHFLFVYPHGSCLDFLNCIDSHYVNEYAYSL